MKSRVAIFVLLFAPLLSSASGDQDTFKGFLVIAPEVEVFRPCGSESSLWLDFDLSPREPIAQKYLDLATTPYEETFAVLIGKPGPKLDCGFCEAYSGSFKVHQVLEHRRAVPTDCDQ